MRGTSDGATGRVARKRGNALRHRAALPVNRRLLWGSEGKTLAPPADGPTDEKPGAMRNCFGFR
ncbi:hypothetical protein B9K05_07910 [Acetobacter syzygii]|uniref:Uncharacterized protein n=1 Tax=Acetobacter syzygii TaxID=146476 RepID=A0A270BMV5_9PROT|nr:hypothetical protein B9K05_07910 [Acetobacter syzygii]PAL26141.1 hypothetical protein B9K04_07405 [Acetobacter syzygii]